MNYRFFVNMHMKMDERTEHVQTLSGHRSYFLAKDAKELYESRNRDCDIRFTVENYSVNFYAP